MGSLTPPEELDGSPIEFGSISREHDGVGELVLIQPIDGQVGELLDGFIGDHRGVEGLLVPHVALVSMLVSVFPTTLPLSSGTYLLEHFKVKTGYDPKVGTTTAPKSLVQVRVLIDVGLHDAAVCEDNLVLAHIVAGPAILAREPRDAATKSESTDANITYAAANDGQTLWVKELYNGCPPIAGTDRNDRLIVRELQAVETDKVDDDAIVDVGAREGNVAARLDGEGRLEGPDHLESFRDLAGGARRYEAVGGELLLPGGPVLVLGFVAGSIRDGDLAREGEAQRDALRG